MFFSRTSLLLKQKFIQFGLISTLVLLPATSVWATNGYFSHGYGAKSKGRAGASTALPQDALVVATNPAGIIFVEDRLDFGVDMFKPKRGASIRDNFFGDDESFDGNRKDTFFIPDFGVVRAINDHWSWAFTAIGHGGMSTRYDRPQNPYARFGSERTAGVDLSQLFMGPTLAYEYSDNQSIGISVNYVYQRFEASGLSAFASKVLPGPYSESPDYVTDNGHDSSDGVGGRIGWQGNFGDFSVGAGYQPKVRMKKFAKYRGLFAEQGGFDIPETYSIGVAWRANESVVLALDYQRIKYADVASVGNSIANFQSNEGLNALVSQLPADQLNDLLSMLQAGQAFVSLIGQLEGSEFSGLLEQLSGPLADQRYGSRLGADNGPGFGWQNMSVYKIGLDYKVNDALTLRTGFSDTEQPVPENETLFNILAPGVVEKHYTVGATYQLGAHEFTMHALYAPKVTVKGRNSIPDDGPPLPPANFGGGEADIYLEEKMFGLSYGYLF